MTNMSTEGTDRNTMATQAESIHTSGSTAAEEQLAADSLNKEKDGTTPDHAAVTPEYVTGLPLVTIVATILFSTLLAALDLGIVATAIPRITDEFHRLDDVGWYGSTVFLGVGPASPLWGKLYKYFSAKAVYIASIVLFLIGSIVAAAAPSSTALIAGRAIQGLGCSGTLGGSVLLISYVAEPGKRPMLIGVWMGVFMASAIIGPLVGGAFTSNVSWRWCFWINLPVGGPVVVLLLLLLRIPRHIRPAPATWKEILLQLDFPGFILLLASLVCFTLALQWGGQTKTWSNGSVITALVMWVVLAIAFVVVEWLEGDHAMVPLGLLKPRMTWANALYCWIANVPNFQVLFYLPIFFQAIHGQSAIASGINTLPFMAFFAPGAMLSGALIGKTRLLQPYELISGLVATAGAAMLYAMDTRSSKGWYVGAQVLLGLGIGLGNQVPMTAVQSLSRPEDVPSTTGIMIMCSSMSGAYFVSAAQSIFANRMLRALAARAPGIDPGKVLAAGASELQRVFGRADLAAVLDAYMTGIKDVFAFSLAGAAFTVLIALVIPLGRLPAPDEKKSEEAAVGPAV